MTGADAGPPCALLSAPLLAVVFAAGLISMALMLRHRRHRTIRRPRTRPLTPDDDDLPMAE